MTGNLKVAMGQFCVSPDWQENLAHSAAMLERAAACGARVLVLPEGLIARDPSDPGLIRQAAQPLAGPFMQGLLAESARTGVALCATTYVPAADAAGRVANVNFLADAGRILAAYEKLHLYAAFGGGEPLLMVPGRSLPPVVELDGWRVGLLTCYDLRFPETARSLAVRGAEIALAPSSWVAGPGKEEHWKLCVRTRALENTMYLAATSECQQARIGRSMAAGPLGEILAEAGSGPDLVAFEASKAALGDVRASLPVLANRRFADPVLKP